VSGKQAAHAAPAVLTRPAVRLTEPGMPGAAATEDRLARFTGTFVAPAAPALAALTRRAAGGDPSPAPCLMRGDARLIPAPRP
jgi:hypothetical protein